MIVVASDLHLTDGRANSTVKAGAFDVFIDRIASVVARQHKAVEYEPSDESTPREKVSEIDVILNGDILDFIRSRRWRRQCKHSEEGRRVDEDGPIETARPWDEKIDDFMPVVLEIWEHMKENNEAAFAKLRRLSAEPVSAGLPDGVKVRVHYLVGNHDWFPYLCAPGHEDLHKLRAEMIEQLGLCRETHRPDWPFPHDPMTHLSRIERLYAQKQISGQRPKKLQFPLLQRMKRHRVMVRHGDIHDPMNYSGDRARASLGDAIVIDILNALQDDVCQRLRQSVQPGTLEFVKQHLGEIDNLRPYAALPSWLQSLMLTVRSSSTMSYDAGAIEDALDDSFRDLARCFIANPFIQSYPGWKERMTATIPFAVSSLLGTDMPKLQEFIMRLFMTGGDSDRSYRDGAYREASLRSGDFDYIVYGHTHHYQVIPLDHITFPPTADSGAPTTSRAWYYLNSGTWRPVQEPCVMHEDQEEFVFYHRLTVLTFFTGDERPTHRYDGWTGVLSDTAEFPIRRTGNDMYVLDGRLVRKGARAKSSLADELRQGLYHLRLLDRDVLKNDLLGMVQPDEDGRFRFGFLRSEFDEVGEGEHPEPLIEVYREGVQVRSAKIEWPSYSNRHANIGDIEI